MHLPLVWGQINLNQGRRCMTSLTWKDLVSTAITGGIVFLAYALSRGISLPLIIGYRGGVIAVGLAGIFLCAFGSRSPQDWSNPWIIVASVLGGLAFIEIVIGLITGTKLPFLFLTGTVTALWLVTTLRHFLTAP